MKRLAAVTIASAVLLGMATAAHAGNTRVVVAGPEADPIANRLQKELASMGFEPLRVDDAAGCSRGAIAAWIEEMHAAGAACSDGSGVAVWVSSRSGPRMADVVTMRETDQDAPDLVAVRAAEVARASLELSSSEPEPAVRPPNHPPSWTATPSSKVVDAAQRRPPTAAPFPRTPALAIGTGIGAVIGADATAPALELELEVRVARYLALATRADLPLQSTTIAGPRTLLKIAPAVFALGPSIPFASADAFAVPRLGGGIGFVWLRSESASSQLNTLAQPRPQPVPGQSSTGPSVSSTSFSSPQSNRDDIFSPLIYGNAAVSLRVAGPFRLVFDGLVGTTAHRMVVRDAGTRVAYWGQPFATIAMRGELVFR